jgi:23S rRNA (guanosine2251-2'-O)-methyltransferase
MRVCGKNVFRELNIKDIRKVYISNKFNDKEIIKYIQDNKISYVPSDERQMDKMMQHHQGIIAEINDYQYRDLTAITKDDNFIVMLDHLEDPHNFGAIIRTCEARGIKNIIIPKDRGVVVNETVMKTSTGALNHVNIIMVTNLPNTIDKLKDMGYFIYAAEADGTDYRKVDYADKKVLVIGSEGFGLSRLVRENSDEIISLPMNGVINSLNASVAAGILIYGIGD